MNLYTKNGWPLQASSTVAYSRSGTMVGLVRGERVFSPDGRYMGTIVNGRLVYRSTDRARVPPLFATADRASTTRAGRVVS